MQQLQLQQAQIQREQARINDFWHDVGKEMAEIEPDRVCFCDNRPSSCLHKPPPYPRLLRTSVRLRFCEKT